MPELPEVETVRRHLHAQIAGQHVVEITLRRPDLRYPIPVDAVQALRAATVDRVDRRAKYLLLRMDAADRATAVVHLGMSGRIFVEPDDDEAEFRKHEHWRWRLDGPRGPQRLRYVDARRFGALDVIAGTWTSSGPSEHPLLAGLGPEPLEKSFHGEHLYACCTGRSVPIKQVLMDAAVVVGIGNIYASETCFRSRISPLRPAGQVTSQECDRLVVAARAVLQEAITAGGSSLRDFVGGDEAPGYFQQRLDVYDRKGEPCNACATPVARCVLGQRATYWCPTCQL